MKGDLKRGLAGRSFAMQVDWLVKPDKQKRTVETLHLVRSISERGKPACGRHLSVLSIGGQPFGTKRPMILLTTRTCGHDMLCARGHKFDEITLTYPMGKRGMRWYQGYVRGGRIEVNSYWWQERWRQGYVRGGRV